MSDVHALPVRRFGDTTRRDSWWVPAVLTFLLYHYARTREPGARDMTLATLQAMANGGIHDQLELSRTGILTAQHRA